MNGSSLTFLPEGCIYSDSRRNSVSLEVEDETVAVAVLGDVTIDLSRSERVPAEVAISAGAILRDVEVIVPEGTHVELSGGVFRGQLTEERGPLRRAHPVGCVSLGCRCTCAFRAGRIG